MVTSPCTRPTGERHGVVEAIRDVFAESPLFREVRLSEPVVELTGEVAVDVSFDDGPPVFRVVAPSVSQVYAKLHELACVMVEVDDRQTPVC